MEFKESPINDMLSSKSDFFIEKKNKMTPTYTPTFIMEH